MAIAVIQRALAKSPAARFDSAGALATVIVLDGVQAISDDIDFSHTVYLNRVREIDSTAAIEDEPSIVE